MTGDGFDITPEEAALRERRLFIRAQIRARNTMHPRCSGCGNYMPVFDERTMITAEVMLEPGYDYLNLFDFRPGDLVCFWCMHEMTQCGNFFQWGHA